MNGNRYQFWKKSTNTTNIEVAIDDPLKIVDTYITDFISPYRINIFDEIKNDFIEQNDETNIRMASQDTVIAPGVCGEQLDTPSLTPEIDQEFWKDRCKEADGIWRPDIGLDDTLPPMPFNDCDQLGIFAYWRPGSSPWRNAPPLDLWEWGRLLHPLRGLDDIIREGKDYRFPDGIPPAGTEPKWINEETGEEIYYYPPGKKGHWWIRSRTPDGKIKWRFGIPLKDDYEIMTVQGSGVSRTIRGWLPFEPCYGVPICFKMGYISPDMNPIHPIQTRPWIYTSYPIGDVFDDPFNNPPGFIQEIPYKTTPPICPECPIKHWRPLTIPQGLSGNTPIYYERGWDPVLGPTYRSPDGEYLPVNPNWILPGRADQERPCNPNGPGFDPSYNA